jgi:DNA-binding transcriptional regulator/RsmH inhibitor MraZ
MVGIDKEVTLVGVGDKIEVHATEQWTKLVSNPEALTKSLEEMAEELSKS